MTTKHTPGPWGLETVRTSSGVCHKVGPFPGRRGDDKPRHACLYADYPSDSNPSDQELLANARLIAAAPELLNLVSEAVELQRKHYGDGMLLHMEMATWAKSASATLAKARGET